MIHKSEATGAGSRTNAGAAEGSSTRDNTDISHVRRDFVGAALTMSWQLAVVVLVPILGGHMLDSRLHTQPWLTLAGLGVAVVAVIAVLKRTLLMASSVNEAKDTHA